MGFAGFLGAGLRVLHADLNFDSDGRECFKEKARFLGLFEVVLVRRNF